MLPLSFVDDQGFRDVMAFIQTEYTVPSGRTITARVKRMYTEEKKRKVESRKKKRRL